MAHNARPGGEIGANGEFYKGGQFVAESERTVKGNYIQRHPRKIKIAPGEWIMQSSGAEIGIYGIIESATIYQWNSGDVLFHPEIIRPWGRGVIPTIEQENSYNIICAHYSELFRMYESGRRTLSLAEFGAMRAKIGMAYWLSGKIDVRIFATTGIHAESCME